MRYHVLACDYDDTLARHGEVAEHTIKTLERVSRSGRKLLLVTGRELDDLLTVFPHADLFDLVVAENGALLYDPGQRSGEPLADPPPPEFAERLRGEGVTPLGVGSVIVATREPYDVQVQDAIRELGLELQVIRNKGAVMVLPPGVNKASGLAAALDRLGLSGHNVVAVGDAENDHAFLTAAECGAAVANAVPALLRQCDLPLGRENGDGVAELADLLLSGELDEMEIPRHHVPLGEGAGGEVRLRPYGTGLVVAGPSGSGKSTVTTALLERLVEARYQCVVIDPEGDYAEFTGAAVLGEPDRPPGPEEVLRLLESPDQSAVVNMIGMPLRDRPAFFAELMPRLVALRARLGHPHCVVVDEAHHLMPAEVQEVPVKDVRDLGSLMMITVHPEALSPAALDLVDGVIAVGPEPGETLGAFAGALGRDTPALEGEAAEGAALWRVSAGTAQLVHPTPARAHRTRHRRKYAAGTMSKGKSFYFTGPEDRLNLRARNLHNFVELAEGVDDETWAFHLRRGDYSTWIGEKLGDAELAGEVGRVEREEPDDSLRRVAELIERRYTLPAEPTKYDPDHDDT
ncbi:HAD hydrolase family protein [Nonomuraea ferruginea]|uniref:HAD hydrolase family protein n=1 Tax=Nonomuraea ferruginea TaxID=46174 RepID=A0ABT4T5H6_9ACTN|nr:HAD hydrolase family protein [Nonomuraea ferruginea]MDA0644524.1 HAD hydrolase family protein [Nonomuraea ferruginea]